MKNTIDENNIETQFVNDFDTVRTKIHHIQHEIRIDTLDGEREKKKGIHTNEESFWPCGIRSTDAILLLLDFEWRQMLLSIWGSVAL